MTALDRLGAAFSRVKARLRPSVALPQPARPPAPADAPEPVEPFVPRDRPVAEPASIERYYDEWHDRYVEVFGDIFQSLQTPDPEQLIGHIAEVMALEEGHRLLDGGCGVAGPARRLAQLTGCSVDGVTLSEVQVEAAEARLAELDPSLDVRVHRGDFHRLGELFEGATFDRAMFLEAFVHSNDPALALASVREVLRPGGLLYIKDFYEIITDDPDHRRHIEHCVIETNRICHLTIRPLEQVTEWVQAAGFDIEFCRPVPLPVDMEIGNQFLERWGLDLADGDSTRTAPPFLDYQELLARRV